jgi:hypothetical protein
MEFSEKDIEPDPPSREEIEQEREQERAEGKEETKEERAERNKEIERERAKRRRQIEEGRARERPYRNHLLVEFLIAKITEYNEKVHRKRLQNPIVAVPRLLDHRRLYEPNVFGKLICPNNLGLQWEATDYATAFEKIDEDTLVIDTCMSHTAGPPTRHIIPDLIYEDPRRTPAAIICRERDTSSSDVTDTPSKAFKKLVENWHAVRMSRRPVGKALEEAHHGTPHELWMKDDPQLCRYFNPELETTAGT